MSTKHTNTETTKPFDLGKHLRWDKTIYIHDDKVVGEREFLQYRVDPTQDWWYNIKTHEDMYKLSNLESLNYYDDVVLRPGVKEQLEALKDEKDDD